MRQTIGLAALVFVGVAAWRIGGQLSSDALGMAVGLLFGIMAGVPTALLVMAANRRREQEQEDAVERRRQSSQPHQQPFFGGYSPGYGQPPVIVLAGGQPQGYGDPYGAPRQRALPAPHTVDVRQFKVVGEKEEWVDEW